MITMPNRARRGGVPAGIILALILAGCSNPAGGSSGSNPGGAELGGVQVSIVQPGEDLQQFFDDSEMPAPAHAPAGEEFSLVVALRDAAGNRVDADDDEVSVRWSIDGVNAETGVEVLALTDIGTSNTALWFTPKAAYAGVVKNITLSVEIDGVMYSGSYKVRIVPKDDSE